MGLIGFECKECNKPFFAMINTPQCILDDATAIKRYQRKGFEFKELDFDASDINNWCNCKGKKK